VPMGVSAVGTGSTQITVTWTPVAGATNYEIYRRSAGSAFTHIGYSTTSQYVNTGLAPNTAYMYRVRARLPNGATGLSDFELATTVGFTDDPIVPGTTPFRAVHLTELRRAVSAVRALAGLPALTFSSDAVPGATVRAAHIAELRTALDPALSSLALAPQPYSEPVAAAGLIKASHIEELRSRLR